MARPELKRGDNGRDVEHLQERLEAHLRDDGIRLSRVDGDFGPITEASVVHFQRKHNVSDDGIVNERTWELLEAQPGGGSQSPGAPITLRMRPINQTVPFELKLKWGDITLDQINYQLSNFNLRQQPNAQLKFLQPVGKLFGNGGIEAINLELRTWPNWFVKWSVQAVIDWDQKKGPVLGANTHGQLGIRPLRGVELTAKGNVDFRFTPSTGSGEAKPSGTIMLNLNILELLKIP